MLKYKKKLHNSKCIYCLNILYTLLVLLKMHLMFILICMKIFTVNITLGKKFKTNSLNELIYFCFFLTLWFLGEIYHSNINSVKT